MTYPCLHFYPHGSFPDTLQATALELQKNCGVPIEFAGPLVLGLAALICQGMVDVARPNCKPSPTSLYMAFFAKSGFRKSSLFDYLFEPILAFEAELAKRAAKGHYAYEARMLSWDVKQKTLLHEIKQRSKKDEPLEDLQDRLMHHLAARPCKSQVPKFIYEDPTPEALVDGICSTWHSVGIISSEAGGIFNGRAVSNLPMLNKLWDGASISVERVGRGVVSHAAPRSSLILAVQGGQFQTFLDSHGAQAMDIGFLPRFLVAQPPNIIGSRLLDPHAPPSTWFALEKFHSRIRTLLEFQFDKKLAGSTNNTVLKFSHAGEHRWIDAYNHIEEMQSPGQCFDGMTGYASKIAENVARIAAIFHFFEGIEGDISVATINSALNVSSWHTQEFLRLFSPPEKIAIEQLDAQSLEHWLRESVWNVGRGQITKTHIRQSGPIRNTIRINNALQVLSIQNKVAIVKIEKTKFVRLNPAFFTIGIWQNP